MINGLVSQENVKYRHNQTVTITKKTVQFGNNVYQSCNVTGFGVGEVESKFPLKFVVMLFFGGLALTQVPSIGFVGGIAMFLAVGLIIAKFTQPKQYGLELQLNSGITEFFITSDLKTLREIIHNIYMMMEKSLEGSVSFHVSDNSVRIEGSVGGSLNFGTVGGNLSNNVTGNISKNP